MNDNYKSKEFNKIIKFDNKDYQVYIAKDLELTDKKNSKENTTEKDIDVKVMEKADKSKEEVKGDKGQAKKVKIKFKKGTFSPHYEIASIDGKPVEGVQKLQVSGAGTYY